MAEAAGRPPTLSCKAVSRIVCKYFNFKNVFEDSIKSYPSFVDQNYYFRGDDSNGTSSEFMLKLNNPLCASDGVMRGLNKLMSHVRLCEFPFSTCYALPSRAGTDVVHLAAEELTVEYDFETPELSSQGCEDSAMVDCVGDTSYIDVMPKLLYHVRVLPFIPGQVFDSIEKEQITPMLLHEIGEMLGRVNKELKDNFVDDILESRKNPSWDLMDFLSLKPFVSGIDDAKKRQNAETIFSYYEEHVVPQISSFEQGIVHCDPNGQNIIVNKRLDGHHLAGLIDFGHCLRTCVVFDVGICLAYIMLENFNSSSVVEFVGPVIGGYHSVLPLTTGEFNSLYYLALTRCLQSAINGERAFKTEPWNPYLLTSPKKAWKTIDILLKTTKEEVCTTWKTFIS